MINASAIGVGCRRGSGAADIESLIRHALASAPDVQPQAIYTIADKADEPGLADAANRLELGLVFLSRELLRNQQARVRTQSSHAERRFGVPSVAEAAALAGAGTNSVLIVERLARDGVTCAIAGNPALSRDGGTHIVVEDGVSRTNAGHRVTQTIPSPLRKRP